MSAPRSNALTTTLRAQCECGRNLLDVRRDLRAHHSLGVVVDVVARPGVRMRAVAAGTGETPRRRDWQIRKHGTPDSLPRRTFSVQCRCGRQYDRREDNLREAWQNMADHDRRVVVAVLGRDL